MINKQIGKEVYAKGVGLIYKELMITEAYTNITPCRLTTNVLGRVLN
ncbi:MAG: hypothetical protein M0D57_11250 [Sphingobacteriales bacterium JAD_PAG50586_3]|nr:MAG: hypothetical protein M0D57_11250 [Sphingobacteriales bacterium JAD_PAG50586_3]